MSDYNDDFLGKLGAVHKQAYSVVRDAAGRAYQAAGGAGTFGSGKGIQSASEKVQAGGQPMIASGGPSAKYQAGEFGIGGGPNTQTGSNVQRQAGGAGGANNTAGQGAVLGGEPGAFSKGVNHPSYPVPENKSPLINQNYSSDNKFVGPVNEPTASIPRPSTNYESGFVPVGRINDEGLQEYLQSRRANSPGELTSSGASSGGKSLNVPSSNRQSGISFAPTAGEQQMIDEYRARQASKIASTREAEKIGLGRYEANKLIERGASLKDRNGNITPEGLAYIQAGKAQLGAIPGLQEAQIKAGADTAQAAQTAALGQAKLNRELQNDLYRRDSDFLRFKTDAEKEAYKRQQDAREFGLSQDKFALDQISENRKQGSEIRLGDQYEQSNKTQLTSDMFKSMRAVESDMTSTDEQKYTSMSNVLDRYVELGLIDVKEASQYLAPYAVKKNG